MANTLKCLSVKGDLLILETRVQRPTDIIMMVEDQTQCYFNYALFAFLKVYIDRQIQRKLERIQT